MRSGRWRGSIYWVLLFWGRFSGSKPLSQKHGSTLLPLQDADPTPSFGGFGLNRTFILNSDTPVAQLLSALDSCWNPAGSGGNGDTRKTIAVSSGRELPGVAGSCREFRVVGHLTREMALYADSEATVFPEKGRFDAQHCPKTPVARNDKTRVPPLWLGFLHLQFLEWDRS